MKRSLKLFLIIVLVAFVAFRACSRSTSINNTRIMKVASQSSTHSLFYSGTIQPFKSIVITSPADGVVTEAAFRYGEKVAKGKRLFSLSSSKFLSDYKSALLQYLKSKNDFNSSKTLLEEAEFLHKNELISDDDFKSKQSNYYSARLTLLQAKDSLENLIHQIDLKDTNIYKLSIADIDKIDDALHLQMHSNGLNVISPAEGVILSPLKSEEDTKRIHKGDMVKQGDILAVVGDMSGLSVKIKVNELTVNQLKEGQPVKVTGIAFPAHILHGEISRIDRQGEASANGLPVFPVEVIVSQLSQDQQRFIHAGMSTKVEINLSEPSQIMIPVSAIIEKNGISYVKRLSKKNARPELAAVNTGKTTADSVSILSGLEVGDSIVISN